VKFSAFVAGNALLIRDDETENLYIRAHFKMTGLEAMQKEIAETLKIPLEKVVYVACKTRIDKRVDYQWIVFI
jgi:hypothetical protein